MRPRAGRPHLRGHRGRPWGAAHGQAGSRDSLCLVGGGYRVRHGNTQNTPDRQGHSQPSAFRQLPGAPPPHSGVPLEETTWR